MRLRLRQRRRERQNRAIRCAARHYERTSDDHFEPYPFGAKIFLPKVTWPRHASRRERVY